MPPRKKPKPNLTFDDHVGRVVDSKRIKRDLTVEELAERSGIGYTTLRRRLNGSGFTVLELERIARAVSTPAAEIVEEALRDFGGMEKLLREDGPTSAVTDTVTPEDDLPYIGRVPAPLDAAADDNPRK